MKLSSMRVGKCYLFKHSNADGIQTNIQIKYLGRKMGIRRYLWLSPTDSQWSPLPSGIRVNGEFVKSFDNQK
jgi:hypothetical protein